MKDLVLHSGEDTREKIVQRLVANGKGMQGGDFTGCNFANFNGHEGADLSRGDFTRASFTGARMARTNLRGANFTSANLGRSFCDGHETDLSAADLTGANLSYANLSYANLSGAIFTGAKLRGADLSRANLDGVDLRTADLEDIKFDLFLIMDASTNEVPGLVAALREGRIDGASYYGECACLIGTIAHLREVSCDDLLHTPIKPNPERYAERWFLALQPGHTPENNHIAAITMEWFEEWMAAHPAEVHLEEPQGVLAKTVGFDGPPSAEPGDPSDL